MRWEDQRDLCRGIKLNWSSREWASLNTDETRLGRTSSCLHRRYSIGRNEWRMKILFVQLIDMFLLWRSYCLAVWGWIDTKPLIKSEFYRWSNNHSFILPSISPTLRSHQVRTEITVSQWKFQRGKTGRDFTQLSKYALLYSFSYLRVPSPSTEIGQTVDAPGMKVRKQTLNLQCKNPWRETHSWSLTSVVGVTWCWYASHLSCHFIT